MYKERFLNVYLYTLRGFQQLNKKREKGLLDCDLTL
jgi:hypothetical protein